MDQPLKKLLIGFMTFLTIITSCFGQNNLITANPCQTSRTGNNPLECTTFFNATLDSKLHKMVMLDLETNKIFNPEYFDLFLLSAYNNMASIICRDYILMHINAGRPTILRYHYSQKDNSTEGITNSHQICFGSEGEGNSYAPGSSVTEPQFQPPRKTNSDTDFSTPYEDQYGPNWKHLTREEPLQYSVVIAQIVMPLQGFQRRARENINSVCGTENGNPIKLNANGETVVRSRFPWITAIFKKNRNNDDIKFHCGGSLVTMKTVVSVAHCFYDDGLTFLRPEEILVSLGRHNVTDLTEGQCLGVERIIGHPQYNPRASNSDADVAILWLKERVVFTLAIRPVCMWQGPSDEVNIQGTTGIVVGWGADAYRNTTTVPTLVNTTVVSEAQCLRSNFAFMGITSNRTLCAGNPNRNSGPCVGDSGNGLMIKKGKLWMLRGAVSFAVGTHDGRCNVEEYAVYSDVAKFMDWIRSNMLL